MRRWQILLWRRRDAENEAKFIRASGWDEMPSLIFTMKYTSFILEIYWKNRGIWLENLHWSQNRHVCYKRMSIQGLKILASTWPAIREAVSEMPSQGIAKWLLTKYNS